MSNKYSFRIKKSGDLKKALNKGDFNFRFSFLLQSNLKFPDNPYSQAYPGNFHPIAHTMPGAKKWPVIKITGLAYL